jgi:hypothetical protein
MTTSTRNCRGFVRELIVFFAFLCTAAAAGSAFQDYGAEKQPDGAAMQPPVGEWQSLFDGKSLGNWQETPFAGRGQVRIENGNIVLGSGAMTGIRWTGPFPKSNYEIRVEAERLEGHDFFAGITFPVQKSFCTWINGGWGGRLVGLSSLDGNDASENETMRLRDFVKGQWYAFLLRVTDESMQAWIDNELVIDVLLDGRKVSLRPGQIGLSTPLGISSYSTTGALHKLEYRLIAPPAANAK